MLNLYLTKMPLFLGWVFIPFTRFLMANTVELLDQWKGEYFHEKQGGFFVHVEVESPDAKTLVLGDGSTIQVTLVNLLTRETYRFNPTASEATTPPKEIWKIHSGKYLIKTIEKVDSMGTIRRYKPKNTSEAKTFIVKRFNLSNLGVWRLNPIRDTGLGLKISMIPNRYTEEGAPSDSSVNQVIDGYNGGFQQEVRGRTDLADKGASRANRQLRTTVTTRRQLAMFYKLNLFKHNYFAKSMSDTLTVYDTAMRKCHTDRMDQTGEDIKGQITFTFLLAKSSGTLTKIKNSNGSIKDPELIRCLSLKLQSIQFSPNTSMIGELSYTFDVK
jgi:hypothetical protein